MRQQQPILTNMHEQEADGRVATLTAACNWMNKYAKGDRVWVFFDGGLNGYHRLKQIESLPTNDEQPGTT
ncbi:unnamed protein product, partial [Amoebophrya sp. A25]|eukprot:GSA25T00020609001.1